MDKPILSIKQESELIQALKKLDVNKTKKFLKDKNVDVNNLFEKEGKRPIHLVIPFRCSTELLEYLLKKDDIEIDALDAAGNTALMLAAAHGNLEACRILIEHGADYHLKSQLVNKNSIEIFKEKHRHLFSSFENIIKNYEASFKTKPINSAEIIRENSRVSDAALASSLRQRKNMLTQNPQLANENKLFSTSGAQIDSEASFWTTPKSSNGSSKHEASSAYLLRRY